MEKDALDFVDDMLKNEKSAVRKNINKNKKQKQYIKRVPTKPATKEDLVLSGWNFEFDPEKKCPYGYKEGHVVELSQKQEEWAKLPRKTLTKVTGVPSRFRMASVFNNYYNIYGWGVYIEDAIKDCLVNCRNWRDGASEADMARVNKLWANRTSKAKKTEDKDLAGLLGEAGL